MTTAKDVQRQIAVMIIITVDEPCLLVAVDRIVGGIEIEDDLFGRASIACGSKPTLRYFITSGQLSSSRFKVPFPPAMHSRADEH